MAQQDDAIFYRMREQQELRASDGATDVTIKRLHWKMAQCYAHLADEAESAMLSEVGTVPS